MASLVLCFIFVSATSYLTLSMDIFKLHFKREGKQKDSAKGDNQKYALKLILSRHRARC